jgi:short subunit dehydrogenase-like uncharacterized protein
MSNQRADRPFEIVLWGVTGYTGKLVAAYLATAPSAQGLRWAIAGRDRRKLDAVHSELRLGPAVEILAGDAADPASLDAICQKTRVVCTTVGPYARYGSELVAACVRAGTASCDLTGEPHWVRRMIDQHHAAAAHGGVRIVHCCGFDSIPSDLGVLFLAESMKQRGRQLGRADYFVRDMKGGASGGTLASAIGVAEAMQSDPALRQLLANPYALTPESSGPDRNDARGPYYEPRLGSWTAPFMMAAINAPIVRRSNALLDYPYGRDFQYSERVLTKPGARGMLTAAATTAAMLGGAIALGISPLRRVIQARLPQPGTGPTPEQRAAGRFTIQLLGEAKDDGPPLTLLATVSDRRDPGYSSTAVMLGESALALARDAGTGRAGVLTPTSAIGASLIDRLRAAGQTWSVEER